MISSKRIAAIIAATALLSFGFSVSAQDGEALYTQYCSTCHNNPVDRAPSRLALSDYNPNAIFHALNNGIMRTQAAALSEDQRIAVA